MRIYFFPFLLLALGVSGQEEIRISSKVDEVTVYRQGSLITRRAEVNLPAGNLVLRFADLMPDIDLNSVKFTATGDLTVQNLRKGLKTDTMSVLGPKEMPDLGVLQSEIDLWEVEKSRRQKIMEVYSKEEAFLRENLSLKSEKEAVNLDDLMRATEFARTRYLDIRNKLALLEDEVRDFDRQIAEHRTKMSATRSYQTELSAEVELRVTSKKPHKALLEISYFYQGAGWYPSYEARVKNTSDDLTLLNYAKVYQRSDEDWDNVQLTITSAEPQLNQTKPQLQPKYLQASVPASAPSFSMNSPANYNNHLKSMSWNPGIRELSGRVLDEYGEPIPYVTVQIQGTSTGTTTDFEGKFRVSVPQNYRNVQFSYVGCETQVFNIGNPYMEVVLPNSTQVLDAVMVQSSAQKSIHSLDAVSGIGISGGRQDKPEKKEEVEFQEVKISYNPTQVRFEIEGRHGIPNDGQQYEIAIQEITLPSTYQYEAVPVLDASAYLTARVSGWEQYNLLPGPLNIYFDRNFVGRAQLNIQYLEDTLALSLGRDPGIKITRKILNDSYARKFIATKRHLNRSYEFRVRNNKREAINLIIYDQIPVSHSADVDVKLGNSDAARHESVSGTLVWDLKLTSGEERSFGFNYEVSYPPSIQLNAGL